MRNFRSEPLSSGVKPLHMVAAMLVGMQLQAQNADREISGLTLSSDDPGVLEISWDVPSPAPDDYRVNWAKADEDFPSWRDDGGNVYPTTNSQRLEGLEEGVEYKVRVRGRYHNANGGNESSTPFSASVQLVVASAPAPVNEPQPVITDADSVREGAIDLGDLTGMTRPKYPTYTLNAPDDSVDYFRFELTAPKKVQLGIRQLDADASITLEAEDGAAVQTKSSPGSEHVAIYPTLLEGTYHVRVEASVDGHNEYRMAHGVQEPNQSTVDALRAAAEGDNGAPEPTSTPTPEPEPTATSAPTSTPEPTSTPDPIDNDITFVGEGDDDDDSEGITEEALLEIASVAFADQQWMPDGDFRYLANNAVDGEEPFPTDIAENRRLTIGETRSGLIWPRRDDDHFVFTAVKGTTYDISMKGAGEYPVFFPRIVGINDPDGNRLANTSNKRWSSLVERFLADKDSDHVIVVDARIRRHTVLGRRTGRISSRLLHRDQQREPLHRNGSLQLLLRPSHRSDGHARRIHVLPDGGRDRSGGCPVTALETDSAYGSPSRPPTVRGGACV